MNKLTIAKGFIVQQMLLSFKSKEHLAIAVWLADEGKKSLNEICDKWVPSRVGDNKLHDIILNLRDSKVIEKEDDMWKATPAFEDSLEALFEVEEKLVRLK